MSPVVDAPVPGLNFTAVDFETANGFRGSPCSVGLVRIRDGVETASSYTPMRPPPGFDRFDPRNVGIHGITAEAVADRPRFAEVFDELVAFIGEDPLVAHNAAFDIEVFHSALEVSARDSPGLECFCSVRLSRVHNELASHALPHAAAVSGYQLEEHHYALEDARAAAAVVCSVARRRRPAAGPGAVGVRPLFAQAGVDPERLPAWSGRPRRESRATAQVRAIAHLFDARTPGVDPTALPDLMRWQDEGRNLPPSPHADPAHPLFDQSLTFTGNLCIPRTEAKRLAARHGATTASKVTAATTMLVVGDGYTADELGAPQHCPPLQSGKAREALRRRTAGQRIRVLSEEDYRSMLGAAWPEAMSAPGRPGALRSPAQ